MWSAYHSTPKKKAWWVSALLTSFKKFFFQVPPWIMPRWRQCTSTLTRQPMMRLRGMKRCRLIFECLSKQYAPSTYYIRKGDNGSPTGFDWRHHGPSHWLLYSQCGWDHLLSSQVSSTFFDNFNFSLNFSLHRFFMSLRIRRTDVVSAVRKRFENHLTRKD